MNSTTAGRIAATSIAVAIVVLGLKSLAAWQSGSLALFSDAVESVVNVATAIAASELGSELITNPENTVRYGDQSTTLRGCVCLGSASEEGIAPTSQHVIIDQMPSYTVSKYLPPRPGRKAMWDSPVPVLA